MVSTLQNATEKSQKVFVHVPSEIAAHEVEEIGNPMRCKIESPILIKKKLNYIK